MPHKLRKTRKRRGSRTCGYGKVGQHRCTGSKGRRNVGKHKHTWSYVIKYEPEHFGKGGFTSPKGLKQKVNAINVGKLDEMVERLTAQKEKGKVSVDLTSLGYTKLLGSGKVTKPLIVKVSSCSESAAEKIKEAGGQILSQNQESGE